MFALVIFELTICSFVLIAAKESDWVTSSDFEPSQLTNLKPQEEHQLLLQALAKKDSNILTGAFFLELVAKGLGNEFFGLVPDKKANRQNSAIVKAAFECFSKLQLQDRVANLLELAAVKGVSHINESGDVSEAFSRVCSEIDHQLKNESTYTSLRNGFKRSSSWQPKKVYQYGVPKSQDDLRRIFAELVNDPRMKRFSAHLTWQGFFSHPDDLAIKTAILELARVPGELEAVQKIYDEAILEITLLIEDVPLDRVDTSGTPVQMNLSHLVPVLSQKLLEKIDSSADLKRLFGPIRKRVHQEILPEKSN